MTVNVRLLKLPGKRALPWLQQEPFGSSARAVCGTSVLLFATSRKTSTRVGTCGAFGRILSRFGSATEALCFVLLGKRPVSCWRFVVILFLLPLFSHKAPISRHSSATLNFSPRLEKLILQESLDI